MLLAGVAGKGAQHVRVEVAPGELTSERLGATRQPILDLPWRETPHVQVGGESRASLVPELVAGVAVLADASGQKCGQGPAAGALPTSCRVGNGLLQPELGEERDQACIHRAGERGHRRRRPADSAPRSEQPAAMEGRENRVRAPDRGAHRIEIVEDEHARVTAQRDVLGFELRRDARAASACEGSGVDAGVNRASTRLPGKHRELDCGVAAADDEPPAARTELLVEVGQRLQQELRAGTRAMAAVQQALVETEHGHDRVGFRERSVERGLIVDAEVATKPHERRGHAGIAQPVVLGLLATATRMTASRRMLQVVVKYVTYCSAREDS